MQRLPSSAHHQALSARTAFVRAVTVTATRGDDQVVLEPDGGMFTQDARRSMRWDGNISVSSDTLIPLSPADILTPFGTRIAVDVGVKFADGSVSQVPFGRYVVDSSTAQVAPAARSVQLPIVDLSDVIAKYRFEEPFTVASGADVADAVNEVVTDRTGSSPALEATGVTLGRSRIFGLDPQKDPWRELQDLAAGFGMRLYYTRFGTLTLDTEPVPDAANAITLEGPSTITGVFETRPPNVVVARGEPSDGPPVQAVVLDDDPDSPTYAGPGPGTSPYGRITRYFSSPLIATVGQATAAARSILNRNAGGGASWQVGRAYDPTWDPDDVVELDVKDTPLIVVVDSVSVDIGGGTTLECREPSELVGT